MFAFSNIVGACLGDERNIRARKATVHILAVRPANVYKILFPRKKIILMNQQAWHQGCGLVPIVGEGCVSWVAHQPLTT